MTKTVTKNKTSQSQDKVKKFESKYGYFTEDGREYVITLGITARLKVKRGPVFHGETTPIFRASRAGNKTSSKTVGVNTFIFGIKKTGNFGRPRGSLVVRNLIFIKFATVWGILF